MATVSWTGGQQNVSQIVPLTVTAAAIGGTLSAIINGKTVAYVCVSGDTVSTAAAAWQALLSANTAPPEFGEITWTVSNNVVTATATTPGTPFYSASWGLTVSGTGGATVTLAQTQANVSQSDVNDPQNWVRNGVAALPQNGDDEVIANSSIPLLWNLDKLSAVQLNSYVRWQSFAGTVGLPYQNPLGYVEYRPQSYKIAGNSASFTMLLGQGTTGSGPTRERYDCQGFQVTFNAFASGSAQDTYAITFLGTHTSNVINVQNTSIGVAMNIAETSAVDKATVDGGGLLALGSGVSWNVSDSGSVTVNNGSLVLFTNPGTLNAYNGAQVTVNSTTALTYAAVMATGFSALTWNTGGTITSLTLSTGATLNKSADLRALTVVNATVDTDSCTVSDPNSVIAWTNPVTGKNQSNAGWYQTGGNRTWKIT